MAHAYETLPSFGYAGLEAGLEGQGRAAIADPAFWESRGASPSLLTPQKPCVIDLRHSNAKPLPAHAPPHRTGGHVDLAHPGPGPICIEAPSTHVAFDKMLQKFLDTAAAPPGEVLPLARAPFELQAPSFGSAPQTFVIRSCAPTLHSSWQAEGLQRRALEAAGVLKQERGSWRVDAGSGVATATGTRESLPSLTSEDDNVAQLGVQAFGLGSQAKQGWGGMTTLMVRNVPVMYTQQLLLKEWQNDGSFDFLYLPCSSVGQTNLSYAFINFVSEAHAEAFKARWHKKRMARFTARKPLNIGFANVQGLRGNILQVTGKRVGDAEAARSQPYIVIDGKQMAPSEALAKLAY